MYLHALRELNENRELVFLLMLTLALAGGVALL